MKSTQSMAKSRVFRAHAAILLALLVLASSLCACAKPGLKSAQEMLDLVLENGSFPELTDADASVLTDIYGCDLDRVDDYRVKTSEEPTAADEIAIFIAKDEAYAETLQKTFSSRIEADRRMSENYDPALYELLLKTEVVQKGRCVFYVINEKSAELTKLLMQNIAG